MKRILSAVGLAVALFASASAYAFDGYVTGNVRLRAGPDPSYPAVARLRAGTSVVIEGCVDDWSWCDVASRSERGWLSGNFLQYRYQGHRVRIPRYGVQIGIPVISFVFGSYWDDHYRSRSWYRDRERWSRVTPHYHGATSSGSRDHDVSSGGSRTYQSPSQAPVGESRRSGAAASQPSYQARPATTVAPQHPASTPARTPERTASPTPERTATPPRPPVERTAVEPKSAPEPHRAMQQQSTPPAPSKPGMEQKAMTPEKAPPKEMPAQSKSPPAQAAGRDKGKDQGAGKDQGNDQGKGKDQGKDQGKSKDQGKDKDKDKDQGGG